MTGRSWFALFCRSNAERQTQQHLTCRAIESYLPSYTETRRWSRGPKQVERILFPGYLFVSLDGDFEERIEVLRTPGAVALLGNGRTMEPIPDTEIDGIRRLLESGLAFEQGKLKTGQRVRIVAGPLRDCEGTLVKMRKHDTRALVALSVQILGRSATVEIDADELRVITQPVRRFA